jgi:hypothetical protein
MDMNHFTNSLFYPRPDQWGLRGDPMLWTDLENHVRQLSRPPKTVNDLEEELRNLYKKLVGESLKKGGYDTC